MIQRRTLVKAVIAALAPLSLTSAFAAGGPSGAHIGYQHQGQLGAVDMNPYKIAPLTAIIRDAGFTIQNIHVRIVPKANGQEIAYKVTNQKAKTYGGIPVFGLYPDYVNTVEVSYTKVAGDKREDIKESYRIYAPPVYFYATGARDQKNMDMNPEVKKVDPEFKDRLYFINNQILNSWKTGQFTWNNPQGGALEWGGGAQNAIIDTTGEVRWFMNTDPIHDQYSVLESGPMLGFEQNKDGAYTWGFGQRYLKYDIMGRKIWNRRLPQSYIDFSHALCAAENGNYFLRVAAAATRGQTARRCGRYATLSLRSMSPAMLLMIGVFGKFSIVIATMSSKQWTKVRCVSILTFPKKDKRFPQQILRPWINPIDSAISQALVLAATGRTSIPLITIRQTIRSFSRYAISLPL